MKTKKLVLLPLLLLSICSCSTNTSSSTQERTITDMIGRTVTLDKESYSRVVCIGAGALRLYSYICDTSLLCGVEDIENTSLSSRPKMFDGVARPYFIKNEELFKTLPSCGVGGPNAQTAESEKILSCNPDIVISLYEDVEKEDALQKSLGVPVVTLRYGSSGVFDAKVQQSLHILGEIFNVDDKATTLCNYIDSNKEAINTRTKDIADENKPNTYICGLGNWGTTTYLMTAQNYEPFNVANIKNAITDLATNGVQKIEEEKFVSIGSSVDKMIIDAAAVKNIKPLYKEDNTIFDSCKAWNNKEVYLQMAYNAYYTNLEIALANTWYNAKVVYPSLFEDIDMKTKLNEITSAFLGEELADEIYSYTNSFGGYQKIDTETFFN